MNKIPTLVGRTLIAVCMPPILAFCVIAETRADCTPAEVLCDVWPPNFGLECEFQERLCQDEDCFSGARGAEILVSASDDPEDRYMGLNGYTNRWLVRHQGEMMNVSCDPLIDHRFGNFVIMPEKRHCATIIVIDDRVYFEFFGSNPATACHAWGECKCTYIP